MKRRVLAGLLTCVMLFGLLPATALADGYEAKNEENTEIPPQTTTCPLYAEKVQFARGKANILCVFEKREIHCRST